MESVVDRLKKAFHDSIHPGDSALLRLDEGSDSDIAFLYGLNDLPWYALDPAILNREGWCFNALSDDGLRYVLPAYLLMFTEDYDDSNGWTDRLLITLASSGRGRLVLNQEQRTVIEELLLSSTEEIGRKYGAAGSTFGVSYSELVESIRLNWNNNEPVRL